MQFAKTIYLAAGVLGLLQVAPAYFMEGQIATWNPPAIEHPEFFIRLHQRRPNMAVRLPLDRPGPVRFRPVMLLAALAKFSIVITFVWLYAVNRIRVPWLASAAFDGTFAVLFLVAYARTAHGRQRG
jgi:hypothetical protein